MGTLPPRALEACAECIRFRRNILVTGITGAGKTTLIRALAGLLPADEPLLILDDCGDLYLDGPHRKLFLLHTGDPADSQREVIARTLLSAQGHLVIGNVCPPEAGEVLRALGSGRHHGSLLSMGASSAETALRQLATWSLVDGFSWEDACPGIAMAIHLVVCIARQADGSRCVEESRCCGNSGKRLDAPTDLKTPRRQGCRPSSLCHRMHDVENLLVTGYRKTASTAAQGACDFRGTVASRSGFGLGRGGGFGGLGDELSRGGQCRSSLCFPEAFESSPGIIHPVAVGLALTPPGE